MTKRKRKKWSMLYLLFWLLITAMFTGLIILQISSYNGYRKELEQVQAELQHEQKVNDDLHDQIIYYESDAYIEQLARDQLGYVRPDEIVFHNTAE